MKEIWKNIPDAPGYQVSDIGRVRSLDRIDGQGRQWPGRIMRPQLLHRSNGCAYLFIRIYRRTRLLQRLVLLAFRGVCPAGKEAAHHNGISTDNRLVNLRWKTHRANCADKKRHGTDGLGVRNSRATLTEPQVLAIREQARRGLSQPEIGRMFSVCQQTVSKITTRRRWGHI